MTLSLLPAALNATAQQQILITSSSRISFVSVDVLSTVSPIVNVLRTHWNVTTCEFHLVAC